jgi:putative ABC transport system ATP-binding protein
MLEVKNITKVYKSGDVETKVLKGISFSINEGEFVAIIGPSGSGKSTLMHILGCLDTPTSGQYFFKGKDVSKLSDDELADLRKNEIGFVFQAFNLLPRTTVLRNDEKRFHHLSNQLSGGEMQRVAIARALVNDPALIFADEPTGNLDSKTGELVMEAFRKLNDQGRTIILITHEKYIAENARRRIFIKDGEIIEDIINHH